MDTVLIVPGLGNSCQSHWQSWFEARLPGSRRVVQRDWDKPDLLAWSGAVSDAASVAKGRVWIVAHSFGCLATAHALASAEADIAGALLVTPADPAKFGATFLLPRLTLPAHTVVVGSQNDAWMSLGAARRWANAWGSAFVNAGRAGHINAASGHGPWPEGLRLFGALQRQSGRGGGAFQKTEYR